MKTNTYLAIIIVLLVLLLGFFAYSISGKAEKRALAHIAEELDSKNSEQMAKLKQIAFDHESIELAYGGFNYLKMMTLEYLQNENKLPNSLADLNLNADWTPSSKIKSVVMQNNAIITITIDNAQSKGTLIFTPSVHQESFFGLAMYHTRHQNIGQHLLTCRYMGQ